MSPFARRVSRESISKTWYLIEEEPELRTRIFICGDSVAEAPRAGQLSFG